MSVADEALNQIMGILYTVKENKEKLLKILDFLQNEIYEEPPPVEVPKRYQKVVKEIADYLSAGLEIYLNTDTLEIEFIHPSEYEEFDEEEEEEENEGLSDRIKWKHDTWENCISFEPLESHESFRIMEEFTESLTDSHFQDRLATALNRSHPFANFNGLIHTSKYRQEWFDFRQKWLEDYVKELLLKKLDNLDKKKNAK